MALATDKSGNNITISKVNTWLQDRNKNELAGFFYDRFYGRYLRPFDYPDDVYKKKYKNGFAIMASCCLMIETFVSWTEPTFRDSNGNGERCFGYFFLTQKRFKDFSKGGLTEAEYLNIVGAPKPKLRHVGTPCDFYHNVRCGILHNGEIKNGWKITREGDFFNENTKKINSVRFMNRLKEVLKDFKFKLMNSNFDRSIAWKTYKERLSDLINNS